ncbi:MAG: AI-2E family transporter [Anaerolineae bacterium]|nr:AI-2E family transporter [Anaerolineae bacterium]
MKKFTSYLGGIWNAFLRGQLTLIVITIMVYLVLLGGLGLRFFIGLALLAGLARFVPYVGPTVAWTTYGLVAYFPTDNLFGLPPLGFVLLVVGLAWITDLVMDNLVGAPLMGNALRIHPAAVMVSALVGANLFGLVGVVLAAPVVATLKLVWAYMFNRLIDQDPWRVLESSPAPVARPLLAMFRTPIIKIRGIWKQIVKKYQVLFKHSSSKT